MLRKLASNTVVSLAGTIAQRGIGFATTVVLARGLGENGFGIYSFVGVYLFFCSFFVDLGMERVVTRELAAAPQRVPQVLGNAILLRLGLCLLVIPAAYGVAIAMAVPAEVRFCVLIAAAGLPLSFDLLFRGYFQSRFEMRYVYAVTLPSAALFLLMAVLCVRWALPVRWVFYAALLNAGLTLAAWLAVALRHVRPSLRPQPQLLAMLLREAGELGAFGLLFMLAMRLDQILLFHLRGPVEVGRYAVGVRVTEALSVVPEALMLTVFPLLASSQHAAPERFRRAYQLSFKYLSAIILPVALALTLARDAFVRVAFGPQYADSALPLVILAWGMFFAYTGAVYLNLFIVRSLQRLMLVVSVIALAVNVAVNLWLIPMYGATGAALATVVGNAVGFAFWALHPATAAFMAVCMTETIRPLASVAVAWGIVALLPVDAVAAALLSIVIYAAVLALLGGVSRADIDLARRLSTTQ